MAKKEPQLDPFEKFDRELLAERSRALRQIINNYQKVIDAEITEYDRNSPPDKEIWSDEFHVEVMSHHYGRLGMLRKILENLEDLGPTLYDYFYHGFFDEPYLEKSDKVPPRTVLGTILHEVSVDLSIIQQATSQRRFDKTGITPELIVLGTADRLAANIIRQAFNNGTLEVEHQLITHLSPLPGIRLIPYWHAIFLGLPFSSLSSFNVGTVKDFLIIPHEVGHLAYWLGDSPSEETEFIHEYIDKELTAINIREDDWRRNWIEELAADLFGLLIAGPVMALEFQYLVTDDSPGHFTNDTSKHPIPVLRPIFLNALMRKIVDENGDSLYKNAPQILDKNWEKWLKNNRKGQNPFDSKTKFKIMKGVKPMTTQEIFDALEPVGDILIKAFGANYDPIQGKTVRHWDSWTKDLNSKDNAFKLFDKFEEYELDMSITPEEQTLANAGLREHQIAYGYLYRVIDGRVDEDPPTSKEKLDSWRSRPDSKNTMLPYENWRYLANMPSWTTEGPEKPKLGTHGPVTPPGTDRTK